MNTTNLVVLIIFLIAAGLILAAIIYGSYDLYRVFNRPIKIGGNGITDVESVRVTEESNVVRPIELIA